MSDWTHVNAIIRFDVIRAIEDKKPNLGKTVDYDSPDEDWDKCDVPCGCEGSLTTTLWTNPSTSAMTAYTASIFGDLRDYSNLEEIVDYLNRICEGQFIRSGIAEITTGYNERTHILAYNNAKWETLTIGE